MNLSFLQNVIHLSKDNDLLVRVFFIAIIVSFEKLKWKVKKKSAPRRLLLLSGQFELIAQRDNPFEGWLALQENELDFCAHFDFHFSFFFKRLWTSGGELCRGHKLCLTTALTLSIIFLNSIISSSEENALLYQNGWLFVRVDFCQFQQKIENDLYQQLPSLAQFFSHSVICYLEQNISF